MLAQVWTRGFVLCFFAHSLQWVIYEKNQEAHETFFYFFLFSGNDSDRVCLVGLTMEKKHPLLHISCDFKLNGW